MFRKSVHQMRVKVVLLVAIVVMTMTLVAAPQSVTNACESAGGICNCPGC